MEDHHYVPQCYLRKFLPAGKPRLHYLSTGEQHFARRVLRAAPKSVCFEKGLYQIETDEVKKQTPDGDPFFIERKAFPYETKELIALIDSLERGRNVIASVRARRLTSILLDIKIRNVYVRDALVDPVSIEGFKQQYLKELSEWVQGPGQIPEREESAQALSEKLHREFSDETFKRDLFRSALIKNMDRPHGSVSQILKQIEDYRFGVMHADSRHPLITSDNPGFCLMNDGSVHPLKFSTDMQVFCFPLTPTMLLSLQHPAKPEAVFKSITRRNLPPHMVHNFNVATMTTSTRFVYSSSRPTLEALIPFAEEIVRMRKI